MTQYGKCRKKETDEATIMRGTRKSRNRRCGISFCPDGKVRCTGVAGTKPSR